MSENFVFKSLLHVQISFPSLNYNSDAISLQTLDAFTSSSNGLNSPRYLTGRQRCRRRSLGSIIRSLKPPTDD